MPQRIQRKRTKGWKMPPNTAYVGRPTKWGNPFHVGRDGTPAQCVNKYRERLSMIKSGEIGTVGLIRDLRGKDLACWCSLDQPCHADVLLKIANS